jgi:outer membrane protein assembly factor BamB
MRSQFRLTQAIILVFFAVSCGSWVNADWPEFRGPWQNGLASNLKLPIEWSETKNVRWFTKTNGLGWSSPVIQKNRIYFTAAVNLSGDSSDLGQLQGAQSLRLICLDASSGKQLFEKAIFEQSENAPQVHKKNSHASPTPLLDGDRIFVHFGHQGTACVDMDGNPIWTNRDHAFPPTHGNGGSPILVDGKLIFTCDGGDAPYTLALDAKTGKEVWKTPRNVETDRKFSFATPQLIETNGKRLIISPGSDIVQALEPDTGKVEWYLRYEGFSVTPRPMMHNGILLLSTGFMAGKILAIDPSGRGDVTKTHLKWTYLGGLQTPSMVCYEDKVYMANDKGLFIALDLMTGKEVWKKRLGGGYSASPLLVGNRVYFQSETGESQVFQLGTEPTELAKNVLPGRIFASYAVIDDDLIIRSEQGVYRIGSTP